jgi:hypothetical protein
VKRMRSSSLGWRAGSAGVGATALSRIRRILGLTKRMHFRTFPMSDITCTCTIRQRRVVRLSSISS